MKRRPLFALCLLLAASLACNALNKFANIPGPEETATDAVGGVTASVTPPAVKTPAGSATAAGKPTAALTKPVGASATPAADVTAGSAATGTPAATAAEQSLPYTLDSAAQAQAAMLPAFAGDVANLPDASRYVIDVAITFDGARSATLTGRELIRYTNRQTSTLPDLMLMLWPNDSDEYLGQTTLGAVTIDGAAVQPKSESKGLAARLPLSTPLAPGQHVDLAVAFTTRADDGVQQGARFGLTHGVLIAPTFYPIIPRIVDGQWQSQWPDSANGDLSNSDTAFYAYRVTAPAGVAVAASGVVVDQAQSGDTQSQTVLSGPMRDIALAVGDLKLTQRTTPDGISVNAWTLPEHAADGPTLAQQGVDQVQNLETRVGPYPFSQLDIVDAPGAFGGVEYPGLVYIGVVGNTNGFEEATVHEVGHQWFYSLIGDDQLLQPWLDEAAASYTEVLYTEKIHGAQAARQSLAYFQSEVNSASDPTKHSTRQSIRKSSLRAKSVGGIDP